MAEKGSSYVPYQGLGSVNDAESETLRKHILKLF